MFVSTAVVTALLDPCSTVSSMMCAPATGSAELLRIGRNVLRLQATKASGMFGPGCTTLPVSAEVASAVPGPGPGRALTLLSAAAPTAEVFDVESPVPTGCVATVSAAGSGLSGMSITSRAASGWGRRCIGHRCVSCAGNRNELQLLLGAVPPKCGSGGDKGALLVGQVELGLADKAAEQSTGTGAPIVDAGSRVDGIRMGPSLADAGVSCCVSAAAGNMLVPKDPMCSC